MTLELRLGGGPLPLDAVGLRQLDEVGAAVQIGLGEPLLVDQVLPLAHHTQGAVVEDDGDDGDVVVLGGAELVAVHAEAAVAGAVHHHLARIAHGGPHGGPQAEAHGAEAAGGDELAGAGEVVVLGAPHLMLAHIGGHDGVPAGDGLDGLQNLVGVENIVFLEGHLRVGEHPRLPLRVVVLGELLVEQLQHPAGVADDVVVGEHVLVDLRPVDVDVDDFGVGCEGGGVGGHPVGEAAADGDEQIALVGGEIGGVGAVHTDHAGEQPVIAGAGAAAHDGGGHRSVEPLDKGAELGHSSLGADDPAAHQHQGPDDLFTADSAQLEDIRIFKGGRIDRAILYAASVLNESHGTLKGLFRQIVEERTDILFPVKDLEQHHGLGFSAWCDNNRILIGTRRYLEQEGVPLPDEEYEMQHSKNGELQILYLAVSGNLHAMFVLKYVGGRNVARGLAVLQKENIRLLVTCQDPSLTAHHITEAYRLPEGMITVLDQEQCNAIKAAPADPEDTCCMIHLKAFASLTGGLQAADQAQNAESSATTVQMVSVLFSIIIAALLTSAGSIWELSVATVLMYQAAWSALSIAVCALKQHN